MFAESEVTLSLYPVTTQRGVVLVKELRGCAGRGGDGWQERRAPLRPAPRPREVQLPALLPRGCQQALEGAFARLRVFSSQGYSMSVLTFSAVRKLFSCSGAV